MSVDKEKKFVIRHTFTDVLLMEETEFYQSEREKHFNVDWLVYILKTLDGDFELYLECPEIDGNEEEICSIRTKTDLKILKKTGEETFSGRFQFSPQKDFQALACIDSAQLKNYLINGILTVECHVRILNKTGIKGLTVSKKFDGSDKELWDVVLIINDKKFYVMKQYLASHSTYFKSLFYGNFDESKQSEVELKDIDPQDFQYYLNLIHGETLVNDSTVEGILHMADFFDSKTATKRCEEFLLNKLKIPRKPLIQKFELANKYKLDNLMDKCLSEIKNFNDIRSILPKNLEELDPEMAKTLLLKSLSFQN